MVGEDITASRRVARQVGPDPEARRRRIRRVLTWVGAPVSLVPVVLMGAYLAWANHLPPPEVDRRTFPVPNGFDACVRAAAKLRPLPKNSPALNLRTADPAALRRILAAEKPALDELRVAIRLDYENPIAGDLLTQWPYLAQYRDGARKFVAESHIALSDGNAPRAIDRALDAVEVGSRIGRGAPIVHWLVGSACNSIGVSQAERCVPKLSEDSAILAGRRLDRIILQFPTYSEVLRAERRTNLQAMHRLYTGETPYAKLMVDEERPDEPPVLGSEVAYFFFPRSWNYRALRMTYDRAIADAEKRYRDRRSVPIPANPFSPMFPSHLELILPRFEQTSLFAARQETILLLLRTEIALEAYARAHGRYPAMLAGLTPKLLREVPPDPFAAGTLRYRRTPAGYILYSVGPDGVDDSGSPAIPGNKIKPESRGDLVAGKLSAVTK